LRRSVVEHFLAHGIAIALAHVAAIAKSARRSAPLTTALLHVLAKLLEAIDFLIERGNALVLGQIEEAHDCLLHSLREWIFAHQRVALLGGQLLRFLAQLAKGLAAIRLGNLGVGVE